MQRRLSVHVPVVLFVYACSCAQASASERDDTLADGLTLQMLDVGAVRRTIDLTLPVARGTQSMLTSLALHDPIVGLTLARLVAPDGAVWHDESEQRFDSRIAGLSFSSIGALAVYLPLTPEQPLQPGNWQLRFELDQESPVRRAAMLTRSRHDDGSAPRALDVMVGIATTDPRFDEVAPADAAVVVWRRVMDRALLPHDLVVGRLDLVRDDALFDYAALDPDEDQAGDGCRTLGVLADSALTFRVLLIDRFESIDPESVDGTLGLSPQPGILLDPESSESCAFVALEPFMENGAGADDLDEQLAATFLHEAGHFMGLDHTSEADGLVFDRLTDTADCLIGDVDGRDNTDFDVIGERDGVIDDFECGPEGGAGNLMFWSGVREYAPFVLSADQAWVLRRHPLFRETCTGDQATSDCTPSTFEWGAAR